MDKCVSNKISVLNFVMTLFICDYHFWFFEFGHNGAFSYLKEFSGFIAMAVFFMLSGFLLYQNANTQEDIKKKIHNRVFSLLIPFFIWNFVAKIIFSIQNKSFEFSFDNMVQSYFCGPVDGPIWYLMAIFLLLLLSPLVIKIKNNKKLVIVIFSTIILFLYLRNCGLIPYFYKAGDWWWYWNTLGYLPYYLIGSFAGLYFKDFITNTTYKKSVHILSFIFLVVCIGVNVLVSLCSEKFVFLRYFSFLNNILLIILFWFAIPQKMFKTNLSCITRYSFFMYVMHVPVLVPLSYHITKLIFTYQLSHLYQFILLWFLSISLMFIFAFVIVNLLELLFVKCPRLFMLLSGNRVKNNFSAKFDIKRKNASLDK